jgi:hypothetical protein
MSWWRNSSVLATLLLVSILVVQANTPVADERIMSNGLCFSASDMEFSPAALKPVVTLDNLVIRTPIFLAVSETRSLNLVPTRFSISAEQLFKRLFWVPTGLNFFLRVLRI